MAAICFQSALTRFDQICLLTGVACQCKNLEWLDFKTCHSPFSTHHWPERLPCWNMDHAMANKDVFFSSTWQIVIYFNNNPLVYSVLGWWCQGGKLGSGRGLTLRYWWFSFVSRFWIQHLRGKKITEHVYVYTNAYVYIFIYIYILHPFCICTPRSICPTGTCWGNTWNMWMHYGTSIVSFWPDWGVMMPKQAKRASSKPSHDSVTEDSDQFVVGPIWSGGFLKIRWVGRQTLKGFPQASGRHRRTWYIETKRYTFWTLNSLIHPCPLSSRTLI